MKWISVKDRLPPKNQAVLIYFDGGCAVSFWFGGDKEPPFDIKGPITAAIWRMSKDFQWHTFTLTTYKTPSYKTEDDGRRYVDLYEENFDKIYWAALPEPPEDDD